MLTHGTYDQNYPGRAGVALKTLLRPPVIVEPVGAVQVLPCAIKPEARQYDSSASALRSEIAHQKRVIAYGEVMEDQGWQNAAWIAEATGVMIDSVRQRLEMLCLSGNVESKRMKDATRLYRWRSA